MTSVRIQVACFLALLPILPLGAQNQTDSNTPLHLLQPDYSTPYGIPQKEEIQEVLSRIYNYLNAVTPAEFIDSSTGKTLSGPGDPDHRIRIRQGDFRIVSYEWGVTYAGMLLASEATGDSRYADYTVERLNFIAINSPRFKQFEENRPGVRHPLSSVLHPHALDDAGAMCAAMIKAQRAGYELGLYPLIRNYIDFIHARQFRLDDGTLARNRPQPNSLWLDDLFMSVPALAQMSAFTEQPEYLEDAIHQVLKFSSRMFNGEKGLYMHGWIQGMEEHPEYYWARANGWAIMAMVELLEIVPEDHQMYDELLGLLRRHIRGLARCQSPEGFWHQLIDRNDSYPETSATAIYTYAIARAINRGYVDAETYGPVVCLAWNAVATKVNDKGQVEGTCVGTGMGFDPAFYYHRPVSPFAAHGYGPTLLAGAEMILLLKNTHPKMNDSAVQFYDHEIETDSPIFSVEE